MLICSIASVVLFQLIIKKEKSPKLITYSMSEDACYSLQEISQHNSSISFWIAIHSKVYDVTEFIHKVVRSEVMLTYLFIVAIILYTFAPHSTQEEQKY